VRYLQREGIVVHGIKHPNIVRVIGFDPFAEHPYLIMELVTGPSLRQVIDAHRQGLPIETAVIVLRGMLQAIEAAHAADVLHRDLKPGNVLLNLADRPLSDLRVDDVKVGDFGLGVKNAEALCSIAQSASLVRDDQLVGTLAYMSPDLRDGTRKPEPRTDLYSIGIILFEMLTGERPVGAELPSTVRAEIPPALDEAFRRLYARHERRYETARAALEDLETRMAPPDLPPPPGSGRRVSTARGAGLASCPACGHVVADGDQFCTQCGRQLVAKVQRCPACHGFPAAQDRFCIFCGAALAAQERA
jgi:serine/threonine-protein kinase